MTGWFGSAPRIRIAQDSLPSFLVLFLLLFALFLGFELPFFERQGFGGVLVVFVVVIVFQSLTINPGASSRLGLATQDFLDSGLELGCEWDVVAGIPEVAGLGRLSAILSVKVTSKKYGGATLPATAVC